MDGAVLNRVLTDRADNGEGQAVPTGARIRATDALPITGVICHRAAPLGPLCGTMGPMITVELERVEALELLGMVIARLNEPRIDPMAPRIALLMSLQERLTQALWEAP